MIKLKNILKEVSDDTVIKYRDQDGESKEMKAGSAKTMPMDHPAKKAWDAEKEKEAGGADKKEPEADQVSFDRTAGEDDVDIAKNYEDDEEEYSPDNPHPMAGVTSGKLVIGWDGEWAPKNSLTKDGLPLDKGEKEKPKQEPKEEPNYDEAKFQLDKIFPDDEESIRMFQDIEDTGTAEEMENYINTYANFDQLSQYGINDDEEVKALAKKIMGESSSKLVDIIKEKKKNPGLWANMHAKRKRGEKSDPRSKAYKRAKKAGQKINRGEGIEELIVREQDYQCFFEWLSTYSKVIQEAEYQGKKVELGKVKRGGDKKFYVYAKNPKGNITKVSFGDTSGLSIKTKDPDKRKSFRARHKCDTNPGPKHKARYWSCRMWSGPDAVKNMLKK